MSVQDITPSAAAETRSRAGFARFGMEQAVMAGAIVCLFFLVVFPILWLLIGSLRGDDGFTLEHFAAAVSGRLYVQALLNSLILGAWTGLFSVIIGVPLAWAVSRTNVPFRGLFHLTANLSYLSPPFLTAIAFVTLFAPNSGVINAVFPAAGGYAARVDLTPPEGGSPVKDIKLLDVDYDYLEKQSPAIKRKFNEIFQ